MMLLMNCGQVDSSTFIVTPESWLLTCKLTLLWTIFWRKQVSGEPLLCAVWWTSAETHSSTHSSAWGWSAGAGTAVQYILNIFSRKPCSCRGLIGLKCPGSWWMEWGKKMCADSKNPQPKYRAGHSSMETLLRSIIIQNGKFGVNNNTNCGSAAGDYEMVTSTPLQTSSLPTLNHPNNTN